MVLQRLEQGGRVADSVQYARLVLKGLESRARRIEQVEIHRLLAKYQYIFLKRLVAYQTDTNAIAVTDSRVTVIFGRNKMNSLPEANVSLKSGVSAVPAETIPTYAHKHRHLILSVDDEPNLLQTREEVLRLAGYEVLSAVDGEQALEVFAAHRVDLVVLDFHMPKMDGGIVAQQMKQRKPLVPIIIQSAFSAAKVVVTCANCFIAKGEGPAALLEKIKPLLA
jgi:CheY-like chemotaxis protein